MNILKYFRKQKKDMLKSMLDWQQEKEINDMAAEIEAGMKHYSQADLIKLIAMLSAKNIAMENMIVYFCKILEVSMNEVNKGTELINVMVQIINKSVDENVLQPGKTPTVEELVKLAFNQTG